MAKKPRSQQRKKGPWEPMDRRKETNGGGAGSSTRRVSGRGSHGADSSVASASQFDDDFAGMYDV
jgi:hypothetical protein